MIYNKLTLAFNRTQAYLEPEFRAVYFRDALPGLRIALIIAILFYAVFGILDAVLVPEQKHLFWLIRYAFVIPVAAVILLFSFSSRFEKYFQPSLFILCLAGGIGIELMGVLAVPPAMYSYYAGIILVFIIIHSFFPMHFIWASACSWTIVACYEFISFYVVDTPWPILVNNNFFFISAVLLSMLAGYSRELSNRKKFFALHLLELEKEKIAQINKELDLRIKHRTRALNKKQKMEAIGTLAGGIAHDFNNLLSAIIGHTELALMDSEPGSRNQESLNEAMRAGKRATDLTRQILTFSRQTEQDIRPMDMKPVVAEAMQLIRASAPASIEIITDLESGAWIKGDPTQVHRIIMNLCTNAVHAIGERPGQIEVSLRKILIDTEFLDENEPLTTRKFVQLRIRDTGHGIPREIIDKIFDPFFTTKSVEQGTGMGLSVVHGIVKQYEGTIKIDSRQDSGSTFSIFIPYSQETETALHEKEAAEFSGTEKIVVVDDEPAVAGALEKHLSSVGYSVEKFHDPVEALNYISGHQEAVDLVITDLTMPELSGFEFSRKILEIRPRLPIILCTGYNDEIKQLKTGRSGIRAFLMKPVLRQRLIENVRNVLDSAADIP